MRTMYDAINMEAIPSFATMVGYYVDGIYANGTAARQRFPNAQLVGISAIGTNDGIVGDCEPGAIWPVNAIVDWVLMRRAAGIDPTAYMNLNTWPLVISAFIGRGVTEPHYWVAQYNGITYIPPGAVAKQYADPAVHGTGEFDLSVVSDYWPGVDTIAPDPVQPRKLEDPMVKDFTASDGSLHTFELVDTSIIWTRTDPNNFNVTSRSFLPGMWRSIERAGYYVNELFVRGTGVDGKLYQSTLPDGQAQPTWTLPQAIA